MTRIAPALVLRKEIFILETGWDGTTREPLQCGVMRQRTHFRNTVEYGAACIALKSLEWLPLAIAYPLAHLYTGLLDVAIPRLRRSAMQNLAFALPAENPATIIDGVFRSIARLLVAFARFPRSAATPSAIGSGARAWSTTSRRNERAAASSSRRRTSATGN